MPGILIHILLESLFTSPRNRYSHAAEYAVWTSWPEQICTTEIRRRCCSRWRDSLSFCPESIGRPQGSPKTGH